MSEVATTDERRNAAWTPHEDAQLLERRESGDPVSVIAALLKRPVPAVYARASKLGSKVQERRSWSAEEDQQLQDFIRNGALNNREISEAMGIKQASVCWRIRQLGLIGMRPVQAAPREPTSANRKPRKAAENAWGAAEDGRLRAMAEGREVTLSDAALALGRPLSGTRARARKLNLRFPTPAEMSTVSADAALRAAYAAKVESDLGALAKSLGRSLRWVMKRSLELGLREAERQSDLDAQGIARIRDLATHHTVTEVSKLMGRDSRTLKALATKEGFAFQAARKVAPVARVARPAPPPVEPRAKAAPSPVRALREPAARQSPQVHPFRLPQERPRLAMPRQAVRPKRHEWPGDALGPEGLRKRLILIREVAERMRSEGRLK